ncbi:hypothetical protein CB599_11735 [Salmonella enterica subsp. enterica serovar Adjame]|nr:hypothetical protein [Salmonella enterica subsp. enterica serovar Adjame]
MNLRKLYFSLILKAKTENGEPKSLRDSKSGFEIHHAIPKSWGASDHPDNLIYFTLKQHFVAHHILARLCGGGMWDAYHLMSHTGRYKVTARQFETARENRAKRMSEIMKGRSFNRGYKHTEEAKRNMSEAQKGRVFTDEWKQKLSDALKGNQNNVGRVTPDEVREKIRQSNLGQKRSEETRAKLSEAHSKRVHSEESKIKRSIAMKGRKQNTVACVHCGKMCAPQLLNRWHNDNCKEKAAD